MFDLFCDRHLSRMQSEFVFASCSNSELAPMSLLAGDSDSSEVVSAALDVELSLETESESESFEA